MEVWRGTTVSVPFNKVTLVAGLAGMERDKDRSRDSSEEFTVGIQGALTVPWTRVVPCGW